MRLPMAVDFGLASFLQGIKQIFVLWEMPVHGSADAHFLDPISPGGSEISASTFIQIPILLIRRDSHSSINTADLWSYWTRMLWTVKCPASKHDQNRDPESQKRQMSIMHILPHSNKDKRSKTCCRMCTKSQSPSQSTLCHKCSQWPQSPRQFLQSTIEYGYSSVAVSQRDRERRKQVKCRKIQFYMLMSLEAGMPKEDIGQVRFATSRGRETLWDRWKVQSSLIAKHRWVSVFKNPAKSREMSRGRWDP